MTIPIQGLQSFAQPVQQMRQQVQGFQLDQGRSISLDIAGENGIGRSGPTLDGPSFGDTLKRALGEVSAAQDNAQDYVQRFLRGEPVELHQVMAATEEAGIALEMLVEIRNKVTEAYRSVVNMQG